LDISANTLKTLGHHKGKPEIKHKDLPTKIFSSQKGRGRYSAISANTGRCYKGTRKETHAVEPKYSGEIGRLSVVNAMKWRQMWKS
jgi:hypothetical protein